jgi:hypothetical protein
MASAISVGSFLVEKTWQVVAAFLCGDVAASGAVGFAVGNLYRDQACAGYSTQDRLSGRCGEWDYFGTTFYNAHDAATRGGAMVFFFLLVAGGLLITGGYLYADHMRQQQG